MTTKHLTRRQIEQRVADLLAEHGIDAVPIPVEVIARAEGLPIVETEMEAEVSGALIRGDNLRGIAVNARQSPVRKRFTVAHELAHFLLEHVDRDHVDWKFTVIRRDGRSSEAEDDQEIAANFFAANLLMPKDKIRADIEQFKGFDGEVQLEDADVILLAKRYRVSEAAMRYRLMGLGLISLA